MREDMDLKKMGSKLMIMEGAEKNETCDSISIESSCEEDSENSISSISALDLVEYASSATSSSSSLSSNGPLHELSELMAELPIRRGLSKHYQGKSQSFTSLASVKSIEDLPKKLIPLHSKAKMKTCKSYGWGLDAHNNNKPYSPKATISKRAGSRGCLSSSLGKSGSNIIMISAYEYIDVKPNLAS